MFMSDGRMISLRIVLSQWIFAGVVAYLSVEVPLSPVSFIESQTALMPCFYNTSGTDVTVRWLKVFEDTVTDLVIFLDPNGKLTYQQNYTRHNISGQASLVISDVNHTDGGKYRCSISVWKVGVVDKDLTLNVMEAKAPSETQISGKGQSNENDHALYSCISSGAPPPALYWLRNNTLLSDSRYHFNHNKSELTINPTHRSDNGIALTCIAENFKGSQQDSTTLIIHFPPSAVSLNGDDVPKKKGDIFVLRCVTGSSNPAAQISWLKNGAEWHRDNNEMLSDGPPSDGEFNGEIWTQDLTINSLQPNHNNASYQCRGKNKYFTDDVPSTDFTITVYFPPENVSLSADRRSPVREEETMVLQCKTESSNPVAQISWYKNNEAFYETVDEKLQKPEEFSGSYYGRILGQRLVIIIHPYLHLTAYKCKGTNDEIGGEVESNEVQLIVHYAPMVINASQHWKQAADEGEMAQLTCIIKTNPQATLKWYLEDHEIQMDDRISIEESYVETTATSKLLINHTNSDDHGNYTCYAGNIIGNVTFMVLLQGRTQPDPATIKETRVSFNNVTVKWMPGFDGGAEQSFNIEYQMFPDGKLYKSPPTDDVIYTITNLTAKAEYKITVLSTNLLGTTKSAPTYVNTTAEPTMRPPIEGTFQSNGNLGLYAGVGGACAVLLVIAVILSIMILKERQKHQSEDAKKGLRYTTENSLRGFDNPALTVSDINRSVDNSNTIEQDPAVKEGHAYVGASDQSCKGQTRKTDEASTSFAVYAAPDKAKKKNHLDSHPDETPYANVTGPSIQPEPPFLTNGTDGASPYANFKEMNGNKKEPDTAYADVQKTKPEKGKPPAGGKGKKPQRKGKKATAYQAERPYDDVPDETAKNVKPLSSSRENPYEVAAMTVQKPKPQDANVEGLTYADLDFKGGPKTKTKPKPPVKPTEDDAVAYAAVDFSKTVKPN